MSVTGRLRAAVLMGHVVTAGAVGSAQSTQGRDLILATTTSVRDAGLLDTILPEFERTQGRRVRVLAVGSGQAMELGRRGEADLLILHDPAGEEAFVREGLGLDRRLLMHNEFIVVGPATDPARIRGLADPAAAFRAIAARQATFVSRGDGSGTHVKERGIWSAAGTGPKGTWYLEAGQGMGQTLQIANELRGYTLADIGTFLAHKSPLDLVVLVEGAPALRNPYHVMLVNPARFPWIDAAGAVILHHYLLEPGTQRRIGAFGRARYGRSLFVPATDQPAGR
ncbi:MAG TPA: substrate-binding domain-containing protein [Gemmatimonadales bacterium]|nr:substrate-binding domain-containing protein [Gemmatimonadales bacterium]